MIVDDRIKAPGTENKKDDLSGMYSTLNNFAIYVTCDFKKSGRVEEFLLKLRNFSLISTIRRTF